MLRAEKTSQNHDDFKVLMAGVIVALLLMTLVPMITRGWDLYLAPRPFVQASTIQLVPDQESNTPGVLYDADANRSVDATWVATIETGDEKDGPLFLVSGHGSYSVKAEDEPKLWTWASWFDNGVGSRIPNVPTKPFVICVRYISVAKGTEVTDESPKYCSKLYDPVLKKEIAG